MFLPSSAFLAPIHTNSSNLALQVPDLLLQDVLPMPAIIMDLNGIGTINRYSVDERQHCSHSMTSTGINKLELPFWIYARPSYGTLGVVLTHCLNFHGSATSQPASKSCTRQSVSHISSPQKNDSYVLTKQWGMFLRLQKCEMFGRECSKYLSTCAQSISL